MLCLCGIVACCGLPGKVSQQQYEKQLFFNLHHDASVKLNGNNMPCFKVGFEVNLLVAGVQA